MLIRQCRAEGLQVMEIRAEQPEDVPAIRHVNAAAFGREHEADLVDRLRGVANTRSFVAVNAEQQIVGHIFFSPVTVDGDCIRDRNLLGLAPMAVQPEYQRQGIGSQLIRHGLDACRQAGYQAVVVLGHPDYYPRFGFVPAIQIGLTCEYPVPDEVFMVLELEPNALRECSGTVKYRPEFDDCE